MTRLKAIKSYCLDCSGEVSSDVIFCQIQDCPLWTYRLGTPAGSSSYNKRVTSAWGKNSQAMSDITAQGLNIGFFKPLSSKKHRFGAKVGSRKGG